MTVSNNIIVFLRNNQAGKVKTRLAATVGNDVAAQIYQELCTQTRLALEEHSVRSFVYYSDFIVQSDDWDSPLFVKKLQHGDNLGQRMSAACREVLSLNDVPDLDSFDPKTMDIKRKVLLIGTDCPYITPRILEAAWQVLSLHDVVIGPAVDGGYYLIGLNEWRDEIFSLSEWSTSTVCKETITILENMGLTYALLPMLEDIDREEDWDRYLLFRQRHA